MKFKNLDIIMITIVIVILIISFYFNAFGIIGDEWLTEACTREVYDGWIDDATIVSDQLVIGQTIVNRIKPFSSDSFFLLDHYLKDGAPLENVTYKHYNSHNGLHSWLLSILGLILFWIKDIDTLYQIYMFITCLFTATVFSLLLHWIKNELGILAFVLSFFTVFLSPWIIILGRSIYWILWIAYLPMLMMIYFLSSEKSPFELNYKKYNLIAFFTILFYCLCRYEYISTVLVMMTLPAIYYAIKEGWDKKQLIKIFLQISFWGVLGFFTAYALHFIKTTILYTKNISETTNIMFKVIVNRTSFANNDFINADNGTGEYLAGKNASLASVLSTYIITGITGRPLIKTSFKIFYMKHYTYLFGFSFLLTFIDRSICPSIHKNRKKIIAFALITAISFIGPLSWIILAKKHCYIHNGINYILWFMPTLIFILGLFGNILQSLFSDYVLKFFKKTK